MQATYVTADDFDFLETVVRTVPGLEPRVRSDHGARKDGETDQDLYDLAHENSPATVEPYR